jgi:hypothetical protein
MKKIALIIPAVVLLFGCNSAQDAAHNTVNSALESAIESQTGQEIDLADIGSFEDNAVKGSFKIDGVEKITGKTKMVGTIIGTKESTDGKMLGFQFQDQEGTMIMITISKFPNNFSLPFTTKMYKQNEAPENTHSAIVTFIKASESSMFAYLSFDGNITINELNERKASLVINGKGGDAANLETPEKWNDMKADFTITSPIIQTMGFDKNEILK